MHVVGRATMVGLISMCCCRPRWLDDPPYSVRSWKLIEPPRSRAGAWLPPRDLYPAAAGHVAR